MGLLLAVLNYASAYWVFQYNDGVDHFIGVCNIVVGTALLLQWVLAPLNRRY